MVLATGVPVEWLVYVSVKLHEGTQDTLWDQVQSDIHYSYLANIITGTFYKLIMYSLMTLKSTNYNQLQTQPGP